MGPAHKVSGFTVQADLNGAVKNQILGRIHVEIKS